MAYAKGSDGISLWYETAGEGVPIVFVHEFGGDHRSWEPQMNYFARRHRCLVFAARGYPPSDVPEAVESYSQDHAADDVIAVMNAAEIDKAHIVGLSMGGFAVLHVGLRHADRALSLCSAGTGYGAEKTQEAYFREASEQVAREFESQGAEAFAKVYAESAARVQFQEKDPRGWQVFADRLGEHSALGAANTMRGVQARRPSLYDLEDRLRRLSLPVLIMAGDEDDHCLQPGIFLKRTISRAGLAILPKTGHTMNLEEPDLFNRLLADFIASVEAGRWGPRDPRATPDQVMRTD
jgi:pimeloyl-ACP methyl ester carboxylesterase